MVFDVAEALITKIGVYMRKNRARGYFLEYVQEYPAAWSEYLDVRNVIKYNVN